MIISFSITIARRASEGLNLSPTQMIISFSPNTSLTRQRRVIQTPARVPQSHSPTNPHDHLVFPRSRLRRPSKAPSQNFCPSKDTIPLVRVKLFAAPISQNISCNALPPLNELSGPIGVGLFGAFAGVKEARHGPRLIEQLRRLRSARRRRIWGHFLGGGGRDLLQDGDNASCHRRVQSSPS